jgi:hypothetical protein
MIVAVFEKPAFVNPAHTTQKVLLGVSPISFSQAKQQAQKMIDLHFIFKIKCCIQYLLMPCHSLLLRTRKLATALQHSNN